MDFLSFFKHVDIFGVGFNAKIFAQKQYKTLYGSFLTIIFFALAIYKLGIILSQTINKTNFTVTEEKDILSGENQTISSFFITVCAGISDNESFEFWGMSGTDGSYIDPHYNETVSKNNEEHCYSYNISNSIISSGSTEPGFVNDEQHLFSFIFEYTDLVYSDGLRFLIDEVFIKRSDYYNPVRTKNFPLIVENIAENPRVLSLYLETMQVKYKNTYNFGFIKYEQTTPKNYTSYYSYSLEPTINFGFSDSFKSTALAVYHSDWIITYIFSGFELDSILSEFGGYLNICYIILNFIGTIINNFFLKKYVLRELNKRVSNENILANKLRKSTRVINDENNDKDLVKDKNKSKKKNLHMKESINEIHILNSFGRMDDINPGNKSKQYEIINIPKKNIINCSNYQINPTMTVDQDESNIILGINNQRLINSLSIKEHTEEKYNKQDEERFKLFKEECNKINEDINEADELYNNLANNAINKEKKEIIKKKINERLFEESMDYSYFYIIFKELKLLELLVLKPDDATLFFEYKNKLLDFSKLMILLENKKIQENIFCSKLYKEHAISKCII